MGLFVLVVGSGLAIRYTPAFFNHYFAGKNSFKKFEIA
jgi:hypothetical protein